MIFVAVASLITLAALLGSRDRRLELPQEQYILQQVARSQLD